MHAAIEEIELDLDGRRETLLVQLGETDQDAITAKTAFGDKPVEEIRAILTRLLQGATDPEAALAEVGCRIVG